MMATPKNSEGYYLTLPPQRIFFTKSTYSGKLLNILDNKVCPIIRPASNGLFTTINHVIGFYNIMQRRKERNKFAFDEICKFLYPQKQCVCAKSSCLPALTANNNRRHSLQQYPSQSIQYTVHRTHTKKKTTRHKVLTG